MASTWVGAIGLIGATLFVALYFNLLATSETPWVGLLPFVFPIIVAGCLGLAAYFKTVRPKETYAPRPAGPLPASTEFVIRGDPDDKTCAWVVRYSYAVGSDRTTDPKPTLEAAIDQARHLRDQRGAIVIEIALG